MRKSLTEGLHSFILARETNVLSAEVLSEGGWKPVTRGTQHKRHDGEKRACVLQCDCDGQTHGDCAACSFKRSSEKIYVE